MNISGTNPSTAKHSPGAVELTAGTLRHRVLGPADGPAVVFVHGALVDGTLWQDVDHRLADRGIRTFAPDWPLGSHRVPMAPTADLTPRGQAHLVAEYLRHLDLSDVTAVANDSGGAVTQLLLDTDASRVGRVVFTNCDTFARFPPPPFRPLFRAARSPGALWVLLQPTRITKLRHALGFGPLVKAPLDPALTWGWIEPSVTDGRIRRDFARFARGVDAGELVDASTRLHRFDGPVLVAWAPEDRFFRIADGRKLAGCFAEGQARVVEIPGSRTFVAHDQPERLATEILRFLNEDDPAFARGASRRPREPLAG